MVGSFLTIENSNRKRISRKLRLEVSEKLQACGEMLEFACERIAEEGSVHLKKPLQELLLLNNQICESVSRLLTELVPPAVNEIDLAERLKDLCLVLLGPYGIRSFVLSDGNSPRGHSVLGNVFFKVAMEALMNISKHSRARRAVITIQEVSDEYSLTIADDGIGFDPGILKRPDSHCCLGLVIMNSWVNCVGGHLFVDTKEGEGTRVIAKVNIKRGVRDLVATDVVDRRGIQDMTAGQQTP